MADIKLKTLEGGETTISKGDLDAFASGFKGTLLTPGAKGYDEARTIWNAMIDRRPGLIVQCSNADDVSRAVKFAGERGLLLSVRGAGHNIAGNAVCEGGLMVDLSPMNSVEVNAKTRRARIGPGATLGDVDQAVQKHGLVLPVGINSTTGISGLTLGGGFGWLSRTFGLTIDNLVSAEVVTADGQKVTASATDHSDLFWGLRGGGGNFGVVTSFEFNLHPFGPDVIAGLIVHPFKDVAQLLRAYREAVAKAPEELTCWVVMRKAPPLPFLSAEVHGKEVVVFAMVYAGSVADGEKAVKPIRAIGTPIADVVGPTKYVEFQTAFDPLLTPGVRNYCKSHDFLKLDDGLIDALIDAVGKLPTEHCEVFIGNLGGAVARVAADATAYTHRDAQFVMNVHTRWESPGDDARCVRWARELFDRTSAFATGGVYVNFMPEDETDRVAAAYGVNHDRLMKLKNQYDPRNLFRMNQNIRPTSKV